MTRGTLLVVDDNKTNRDVMARRLLREGYEVVTVENGRAALAVIHERVIDMVFLDLMMPEMTGIEVLQQLRQTHGGRELPVLVVSSATDTPQMVEALDHGANDYVTKPVDFALLLAKTRCHLALQSSLPTRVAPPFSSAEVGPGQMLGLYLVGELLGTGGMGKVFRAKDVRLKRDVALKVLGDNRLSKIAKERFLQEAQAVARVSHAGVVAIYDIATEPVPFIAMELLEGQLLSQVPRPGPKEALRLIRQVLRALAAVHQAGVTHRDIKPSNIMVTNDMRVKVFDFGLATLEGQMNNLTTSGAICGTPHYMAPEQLQNDRGAIDAQTDIFSVAAILYELVTGKPVFSGVSLPKIITEILFQETQPPKEINPALTDELSLAIVTGLQKKKELRYPNCQKFLEALDQLEG